MHDLREQIHSALRGRVCFMGLGNTDRRRRRLRGAAGGIARNASASLTWSSPAPFLNIWLAVMRIQGSTIWSSSMPWISARQPGSVVFLNSAEMAARFPQVSTHKISLGMLAKCVENGEITRVWLLGAQPASLQPGPELSPAIQTTVDILADLIGSVRQGGSYKMMTPEQAVFAAILVCVAGAVAFVAHRALADAGGLVVFLTTAATAALVFFAVGTVLTGGVFG